MLWECWAEDSEFACHSTCLSHHLPALALDSQPPPHPSPPTQEGDLAIHIACKKGSAEVLNVLLSVPGIQVDRPDIVGACGLLGCGDVWQGDCVRMCGRTLACARRAIWSTW